MDILRRYKNYWQILRLIPLQTIIVVRKSFFCNLLNPAIQWASENGHTEVVKNLLADSRVDPSAGNNSGEKNDCFKLILWQQFDGNQCMDTLRWYKNYWQILGLI